LISEFIVVQIISVTLIYVVTSREFLRLNQNPEHSGTEQDTRNPEAVAS